MALDVSGDDRIDIVGESFYKEALRRVANAERGEEPARQHVAQLIPDPTNAYDRNAIKVVISGEHVGHLPRELAALVAPAISELTAKHGEVVAIAELIGSGAGFGVVLYLKLQMLNVVVHRDDGEDFGDTLLITDAAPVSSRTRSSQSQAPRTTEEAAKDLGVDEAMLEARRATMERAVERWKSELIDLSARNRLLYFRDLQTGTLSFDDVEREHLMQLVAGKRVPLSRLIPRSLPRSSPVARLTPFEDAVRRARAITRVARSYEEERGVRTLFLACGMATWKSDRASRPPAAPVLLVPIEIRARGASQQDFELSTIGDLEVNPTLLHLLKIEYRLDIDEAALFAHTDMDGAIDTPEELRLAFNWLSEHCASVPGWAIGERFVLGNFWYAKLPMVRDLETSVDTLSSHDVAAALAGHAGARESVLRRRNGSASGEGSVDDLDPRAEFNVLDSDSSQSSSIARALHGEDLVLKGPPGTGKSQTIANLICGAIGAGKRVLFVAEKRAAIEAVTKRLDTVRLGSLVLDLHQGAESRKWLAGQLGESLAEIRAVGSTSDDADHAQLVRARDALKLHAAELHQVHAPWNVSLYRAQSEVLRLGRPRVVARLRGEDLRHATTVRLAVLVDHLRDLVSLGGLSLRDNGSPWGDAEVTTAEDVDAAITDVRRASGALLGSIEGSLTEAATATGLPGPVTLGEAERLVELWNLAAERGKTLDVGIYGHDLGDATEALRPLAGSGLSRAMASMTSSRFRAARKLVQEHLTDDATPSAATLFEELSASAGLQKEWSAVKTSDSSRPAPPAHLERLATTTGELRDVLTRLGAVTGRPLVERPLHELRRELSALEADHATLAVLPDIHRARTELAAAGLGSLLTELEGDPGLLPEAETELHRLWWLSLADELTMKSASSASFAAFRGERHEQTLMAFKEFDHKHIASSAQRVQRAAAEFAVRVQDQFPEQAQLVRAQATRKRGHMPIRELFLKAPDVITALRPCWVMSPLMVSQLIPSERAYFDIVVFDEASQVRPVDALSSMIRGRQLVVAGDERQLPPTAFFDANSGSSEDATGAEDEEVSEIGDYESILDVLMTLFETETLRWHYRSRDERLIGFSNREIYGSSLTTFPGAVAGDVLTHVLVDELPGEDEVRVSPQAEVERVVELVLNHATARPTESLGVIALGIRHADAIEAQLLAALADRPDLEEFFSEDREERFFVKNLERVQGDERDAIILAVGYGKNPDGSLPHRFGPLNAAGGERRLNVAVSRAKHRMTVVSSFEAGAIDPARSSANGVRLLRAFLEYAAAGGAAGDVGAEEVTSSELHHRIEAALTRAGYDVVVLAGTSADRLDLAVLDPESSLPAVAIEVDGPRYAGRRSVRDRDRLRPEQLTRLGWQHVWSWSQDWYRDPDAAAARLIEQVRSAIDRHREVRRVTESNGSASADGPATVTPSVPAPRPRFEPRMRAQKPDFRSGGPAITDWHHADLVALGAWIESDGLLRTSDELQREMMQELGLSRRGARVAAALDAAVLTLRSID